MTPKCAPNLLSYHNRNVANTIQQDPLDQDATREIDEIVLYSWLVSRILSITIGKF